MDAVAAPAGLALDPGFVSLAGSDVSRRHAALRRADEVVSIMDLGSRNGTRVNGHAVRTAQLRAGDVVRLGPWVGVVTFGSGGS